MLEVERIRSVLIGEWSFLPWTEIEHTADMGLEISAEDHNSLLYECTAALYSVMFDEYRPGSAIAEKKLFISGVDLVEIFVSWMNELLYLNETMDALVVIENIRSLSVKEGLSVNVQLYCAPSPVIRIKAVTYGGVLFRSDPSFLRVYLDL